MRTSGMTSSVEAPICSSAIAARPATGLERPIVPAKLILEFHLT
jgi:hypothetical protein